MKKFISLLLSAMLLLAVTIAMAATSSITVDDLTTATDLSTPTDVVAPVVAEETVDLAEEAQDAHDAFMPGLPTDTSTSGGTENDTQDVVSYVVKSSENPEEAVAAVTTETAEAVAEILGTDAIVVNEVVDLELDGADEVQIVIAVASVYEPGEKLAIIVVIGDEQYVLEGTVAANGAVVFTVPADLAEKIVANNGAMVLIASAE